MKWNRRENVGNSEPCDQMLVPIYYSSRLIHLYHTVIPVTVIAFSTK